MIQLAIFNALLLLASPETPTAAPPTPLQALENKLQGAWKGKGPCDGELLIRADGTFQRRHFSPGNNSLSGKWQVRWDALPPTLVLVCETSDRDFFVGKTTQLAVLTLNEADLVYRHPSQSKTHYTRQHPSIRLDQTTR